MSGIGKVYPEPGLKGNPGNYSLLVEAEDRGFPAKTASAVFLVCVQVTVHTLCLWTRELAWKSYPLRVTLKEICIFVRFYRLCILLSSESLCIYKLLIPLIENIFRILTITPHSLSCPGPTILPGFWRMQL